MSHHAVKDYQGIQSIVYVAHFGIDCELLQNEYWYQAVLVVEKLAHERKSLGLALAPLRLHWQIIARSSKLGRESLSVNPA